MWVSCFPFPFDGPALRSKTGFNIYLTFEGERDTICNLSIKGVLQLIKRWRLRQRKTARSCSSPSPLTFQGQPPSSTKVPLELGRFSLVTIGNSSALLPRFRGVKLKDGVISPPTGGWEASPLYIAVNPVAEEQVLVLAS